MCYACIYQRMTKVELKSKLLSTGIFVDNEWLDKYVDLIITNQDTVEAKFKTQCHHVIPSCYYRNRNLLVDSSANNLVNLLLHDHLIAHCYLVLCSMDKRFKANMFYAICFISGQKVEDDRKVVELIQADLSVYQKAYEESRKDAYCNNPMFDKDKKLYHDEIMRSYEISSKISSSMKMKSKKGELFSEEHRRNLSNSAKLRCYAYKEGVVKRILKSEAKSYYDEGWNVPFYSKDNQISTTKPSNSEQATSDNLNKDSSKSDVQKECVCWVHKGDERKMIAKSLLDNFIQEGWHTGSGVHQNSNFRKSIYTDEVRNKLSMSRKGKSPSNKGVPCSEKQKQYLSEYWRGARRMHDGFTQKLVPASKIQEYLDQGFVFGTLTKNKR